MCLDRFLTNFLVLPSVNVDEESDPDRVEDSVSVEESDSVCDDDICESLEVVKLELVLLLLLFSFVSEVEFRLLLLVSLESTSDVDEVCEDSLVLSVSSNSRG